MMLQYKILYCRKLNEINQNYLEAREILRKQFLQEYSWIKERIEHLTDFSEDTEEPIWILGKYETRAKS